MFRSTLFFFSVLFILLSIEIQGQVISDSLLQSQPKIGLVHSGGGAKGFAHIGVLKVFEEYGIKPDYISGTSMGSLVAALYSLGYSADELEVIVFNADWNELLTDNITLRDIPIFEKEDYLGYLNLKTILLVVGRLV
ncbi:MAG: patatin-like phospholipase family protein [Bacteroidetes bacterium]|nr:patatin-like phospholipase family protein [Bacteroidota bacterium]